MEAANAIGNKAWLAIAIGDTGADVDGAAIATDNTRWRGGVPLFPLARHAT